MPTIWAGDTETYIVSPQAPHGTQYIAGVRLCQSNNYAAIVEGLLGELKAGTVTTKRQAKDFIKSQLAGADIDYAESVMTSMAGVQEHVLSRVTHV